MIKELPEQKIRKDFEHEIIELKRRLGEAYEMIRELNQPCEVLQYAGKCQVKFTRKCIRRQSNKGGIANPSYLGRYSGNLSATGHANVGVLDQTPKIRGHAAFVDLFPSACRLP